MEKAFGVVPREILAKVPLDPRLLLSERLLAIDEPDSPPAQAYARVAGWLTELREEWLASESGRDAPVVDRSTATRLRKGKGDRFEDQVATLLRLNSYDVQREQIVDGNRIDLLAVERRKFGSEERWLVECKDHARAVPKELLETFATWLNGPQATSMQARGMFVARRYSAVALTYARAQRILALTLDDLERSLLDFTPYLKRLCREFENSLASTYVRQRVLLEKEAENREGVDLLEHAVEWSHGAGSRLWLLLGDYGTGKSTFVRRFAYELAKHALEDPEAPIPLAINLKDFSAVGRLGTVIAEHLRDHDYERVNAEAVFYLLASGRVVLLLDSFDEMGAAQVNRSVESQFREIVQSAATPGRGRRGNRVLVTCRTHFFKDQQQVKDTAAGLSDDLISQDSSLGKVARSFDATIDELMLFQGDQIKEFLVRHLGQEKAEEAQAFIHATYDLPRLAPRPVLLEMIVSTLPVLMQSGHEVTPAGLYARYTDMWLNERGGANLHTTASQRRTLLELLAFELWGTENNRIHYADLARLVADARESLQFAVDPVRIDLELRTAAFLVRTPDGMYGFSHKSFREYFYARFLLRALLENDDCTALFTALTTAALTPETVSFLADLAGEKNAEALRGAPARILERHYHAGASENALRLALQLARRQTRDLAEVPAAMAALMPGTAHLSGAVLPDEDLAGSWAEGALLDNADLQGAVLTGSRLAGAVLTEARLRQAILVHANLDRANLDCADLGFAVAQSASFLGARLTGADLTAADLSRSRLDGADLGGARCHATRLAAASLAGTNFEAATLTRVTTPHSTGGPDLPGREPRQPRLRLAGGHCAPLTTAVFSGDGQRVLTAAFDNTARLWDADSGECLRVLEGHSGWVNSAVFSGDGRRVLTAARDSTARLWNADSGECLRVLEGHSGTAISAVFSGDGRRVLTAGNDSTARLWNAASGKLQEVLVHAWAGWASFGPDQRFRGDAAGIDTLCYEDADERSLLPTIWHAEDLPEFRDG